MNLFRDHLALQQQQTQQIAFVFGKFNAKQTILNTYVLLLLIFVNRNLIQADKNLLKFSKVTFN